MASIKEISIAERFNKPESYYGSDRGDVLALIPKGTKKILDIGCGAAQTWAARPEFEVWGVERNETAAALAKKHLRKVFSSDIDQAMPELLNEKFDVVFLADVLEHLYDLWGLLIKLKELIGKNGVLLMSVPNFGHHRVLKRILFRKEFRYSQEGILDIDHIRFFCKKDVEWMLSKTGYKIERLSRKFSTTRIGRILNTLCLGLLDDLLTEQFIVVAAKNSNESIADA